MPQLFQMWGIIKSNFRPYWGLILCQSHLVLASLIYKYIQLNIKNTFQFSKSVSWENHAWNLFCWIVLSELSIIQKMEMVTIWPLQIKFEGQKKLHHILLKISWIWFQILQMVHYYAGEKMQAGISSRWAWSLKLK